jgi:hypothetical protein
MSNNVERAPKRRQNHTVLGVDPPVTPPADDPTTGLHGATESPLPGLSVEPPGLLSVDVAEQGEPQGQEFGIPLSADEFIMDANRHIEGFVAAPVMEEIIGSLDAVNNLPQEIAPRIQEAARVRDQLIVYVQSIRNLGTHEEQTRVAELRERLQQSQNALRQAAEVVQRTAQQLADAETVVSEAAATAAQIQELHRELHKRVSPQQLHRRPGLLGQFVTAEALKENRNAIGAGIGAGAITTIGVSTFATDTPAAIDFGVGLVAAIAVGFLVRTKLQPRRR